jgi:hypothetical protein
MNEHLKKLITLFLQKVSEAEEILKKKYNIDTPMHWKQNGLPRRGAFDIYEYYFHGIGCRFNFGELSVDYDYGDQGRINGFDLWRLTIFGEQLKEFKPYIETGALKSDFESCIESGEINTSGSKDDDLYYLSKSK